MPKPAAVTQYLTLHAAAARGLVLFDATISFALLCSIAHGMCSVNACAVLIITGIVLTLPNMLGSTPEHVTSL